MLLTEKQTNKQTENITSLVEVKITTAWKLSTDTGGGTGRNINC